MDTTVGYRPTSKLKRLLVKPYPRDPPGQGVYEAKCTDCSQVYIGETGLKLESRIKSHSTSKNSSVRQHVHGQGKFDFALINRCHNTNARKIVEAFEIKKRKPELNENAGVFNYVFT